MAKRKRCTCCNKKIKLLPIVCKCKNTYCIKCRLPETHKCTFDYVKEGLEKIDKENPKIEAEKLVKV